MLATTHPSPRLKKSAHRQHHTRRAHAPIPADVVDFYREPMARLVVALITSDNRVVALAPAVPVVAGGGNPESVGVVVGAVKVKRSLHQE
jgi:hypothetical protein